MIDAAVDRVREAVDRAVDDARELNDEAREELREAIVDLERRVERLRGRD